VDCRDAQQWLHPYHDGELDAIHASEVEAHLADCPECAERLRALVALRAVIAPALAYHAAPPGLRDRVRNPAPAARWTPQRTLLLVASAAAAAALLAVVLGITLWRTGTPTSGPLDQVLASHIRSLQVAHLTDVDSPNGHIIKPWFLGKIDFAPTVPNLKDDGFPLTGGRLDYIEERAVAAIVYHRRQHAINLFLWPAKNGTDQPQRSVTRNGFTMISWQQDGMLFWAVSDLNAAELEEFVRTFRSRAVEP
jgi:anti-sigma factor RsiW